MEKKYIYPTGVQDRAVGFYYASVLPPGSQMRNPAGALTLRGGE